MGGYKSHGDYYAYDDVYSARHRNTGRSFYYRMHTSHYAAWGGHWALRGAGRYRLAQKSTFNMQLTVDEINRFRASINVAYQITPGLAITPEFTYRRYGNGKRWDDGARVSLHGEESLSRDVPPPAEFLIAGSALMTWRLPSFAVLQASRSFRPMQAIEGLQQPYCFPLAVTEPARQAERGGYFLRPPLRPAGRLSSNSFKNRPV